MSSIPSDCINNFLVRDTDYTIKARARGNTVTVTFTFKGNYKGQITRSYVKEAGSGDHSGTGTNNGASSGGTGNRSSANHPADRRQALPLPPEPVYSPQPL